MNEEDIKEHIKDLEEYKAHLEQAYKDIWHELSIKAEAAFKEGFERGQKARYIHAKYTESWLKSVVRGRLKELK